MIAFAENIRLISNTFNAVKSTDSSAKTETTENITAADAKKYTIVDSLTLSEDYYKIASENSDKRSKDTKIEASNNSDKDTKSIPAEIGKDANKVESNSISDATEKSDENNKEDKIIEKYKKREQEVKTHEQAHQMAGGSLVKGGTSYQYTTAPDGKKYISGGEVQIDMSEIPGDPAATISKMQQVKGAALAPSDPSAQDRAVAADASAKESQARVEIIKESTAKISSKSNSNDFYEVYKAQILIDSSAKTNVSSLDKQEVNV